jgi:hypothetical protein
VILVEALFKAAAVLAKEYSTPPHVFLEDLDRFAVDFHIYRSMIQELEAPAGGSLTSQIRRHRLEAGLPGWKNR